MALHWLVDADHESDRSEELKSVIRSHGHDCRPVKFFPERMPPGDIAGAEQLPIDARAVYFGGPALMSHIQTHRRWRPGGWCTFQNFGCETYYCYFGRHLLNQDYILLPAAEAIRRATHIFAQISAKDSVFVRPAVGRKLFVGRCMSSSEYLSTLSNRIDPQSLVVISSPKTVGREWRMFVAHDRVITSSQYADGGQIARRPGCPTEVISFATAVLRDVNWRPDPLFTMDICECDGRLAVVEINGFSCSDHYASDLNEIVDTVGRTARAY